MLHLWHIEGPRWGVKSELQLPAYTTATVMWDPSRVCDLHYSSRQHQILNPRILNPAKPGIEPASSWILVEFVTHWAITGTRDSLFKILLMVSKDLKTTIKILNRVNQASHDPALPTASYCYHSYFFFFILQTQWTLSFPSKSQVPCCSRIFR